MTRIYVYLAGALVGALITGALYIWGQEGHQKAREAQATVVQVSTQLETANASLKAAEAARLVEAQRVRLATKRLAEAQADNEKLRNALKDNPGWAAEPVPDSVWDALTSTSSLPGPEAFAKPAGELPSPEPAGP